MGGLGCLAGIRGRHFLVWGTFVILKSQRKMGSSKWLASIYFGVLYFFFSGKIRYIQTFN